MQIGAMNSPYDNIYDELEWIGKKGFDFVDFTIEPTHSMPEQINVAKAKKIMRKHGLGIVGHIGDWRLPKDSDYPCLRKESEQEMLRAIRLLKKLGAEKINFHAPVVGRSDPQVIYLRNRKLIRRVLKEAKKQKVHLMMENSPHNDSKNLKLFLKLINEFPSLGIHIDVGHANLGLQRNLMYMLMKRYPERVLHLHFSDNYGNEDNHIKLGAGRIPWTKIIKVLKKYGYDGTITVETFRSGKKGTLESKSKLRKWWDKY